VSESIATPRNDTVPFGRGAGFVLAVFAVASVVFEQSPANEALRANIAFRALDYTGDAVLVGLVVFALTIVIEGVPAGLIIAGMRANPAAMEKLSGRIATKGSPEESDGHRRRSFSVTDAGVALGIGAAIVVLKRALSGRQDPNDWQSLGRAGASATLVVAVVSGLIGYIVAGGVETAARYGLETPAEYVVRYGANWRFWFVVVAAVTVFNWIFQRAKARNADGAAT